MSATTPRARGAVETTALTRRWLSQAEAADYLGVTDRTIRNYIRTGALVGRRPPGSRLIRIDRHELDAAMRPIPSAKSGGGGDA